jgi:hypothetical protein
MTWENLLTARLHNGEPMSSKSARNFTEKYKWQIIPYHNSDNTLNLKERVYTMKMPGQDDDEAINYLGGMWKLGRIHEYPDICVASAFTKRRDEMYAARDVGLCHGFGRITPIHFYLSIKEYR